MEFSFPPPSPFLALPGEPPVPRTPLTTRLSQPSQTSGTGHRPLRIHRLSERLQQCNFTLQFIPGHEDVVVDLLSRATSGPSPDPAPVATEPDLVQLSRSIPHSRLQSPIRTSSWPQSRTLCSPSSAHSSALFGSQRFQRSWHLSIV